ncbi:hypothetical protein DdX_22292 [Ditylenchus destructor]|uniref:Uncharacterized protein n=1 Tax=Ditylenchus destructor TaxID=166010 RepID=A0AAD4QQZ4_9BILA|nr:hypothetical protein DdX_22292 [Ditylenchus destructor]
MFNEVLSSEKYNELIVRNGYSKQIPHEVQISGKESSENDRDNYVFIADACPNPNNCQDIAKTVFYARAELKDETWPLFQHFFRLLMDPFIYIRYLSLTPKKDVFTLLTGAMNPDRGRLQCKQLIIHFNDDTQKFIVWIKDHVRCDELKLFFFGGLNCDEELLGLFLTGAPCTSAIYIRNYDLSKVIVDLVQKRNLSEFIAEEELIEEGNDTRQIIEFINNDIEKKLTLNVGNPSIFTLGSSFSIKITNL